MKISVVFQLACSIMLTIYGLALVSSCGREMRSWSLCLSCFTALIPLEARMTKFQTSGVSFAQRLYLTNAVEVCAALKCRHGGGVCVSMDKWFILVSVLKRPNSRCKDWEITLSTIVACGGQGIPLCYCGNRMK